MIKAGCIFTDRAALQCDMPVPVWGETDAAALNISFGGQTVCAEVKDGFFRATLAPMAPGVRGEMHFFSETEELVLSDTVTGEQLPLDARIEESDILLTLPEGVVPDEIGYVLQNFCRANLYGEDGLAVSPFLFKI